MLSNAGLQNNRSYNALPRVCQRDHEGGLELNRSGLWLFMFFRIRSKFVTALCIFFCTYIRIPHSASCRSGLKETSMVLSHPLPAKPSFGQSDITSLFLQGSAWIMPQCGVEIYLTFDEDQFHHVVFAHIHSRSASPFWRWSKIA